MRNFETETYIFLGPRETVAPDSWYCLAKDMKFRSNSEPEPSKQPKRSSSKCDILIVEDERLIAETLKEQLEENDYRVVGIVDSAEQAIDLVRKTMTDLVIIDIRLKGSVDGIQTALILHQTVKKLPIIFLTAHPADQFPHLALLDKSLFVYLTKPYSDTDLLTAIRTLKSKTDISG
jgi:DNA-binding response OmpR family regulator